MAIPFCADDRALRLIIDGEANHFKRGYGGMMATTLVGEMREAGVPVSPLAVLARIGQRYAALPVHPATAELFGEAAARHDRLQDALIGLVDSQFKARKDIAKAIAYRALHGKGIVRTYEWAVLVNRLREKHHLGMVHTHQEAAYPPCNDSRGRNQHLLEIGTRIGRHDGEALMYTDGRWGNESWPRKVVAWIKPAPPDAPPAKVANNGEPVPGAVYFHRAGRELLYIGLSSSLFARTRDHERGSRWFTKVTRIDVKWFETRDAAAIAETKLIRKYKPPYNIANNPGYSGA